MERIVIAWFSPGLSGRREGQETDTDGESSLLEAMFRCRHPSAPRAAAGWPLHVAGTAVRAAARTPGGSARDGATVSNGS